MSKTIQIVILEPSFVVYEGLAAFLKRTVEQYAVQRADDFEQLQQIASRRGVDMVLINPSLVQNAQKPYTALKSEFASIRWIAIVYSIYPEQLFSNFDARISIADAPNTVLDCIKNCLTSTSPTPDDNVDTLSDREIEVLKLLAAGFANKEIADRLNISINTVITHRKNISQKTGIKSISGLTIYAVVKKFVSLDVLSTDDTVD